METSENFKAGVKSIQMTGTIIGTSKFLTETMTLTIFDSIYLSSSIADSIYTLADTQLSINLPSIESNPVFSDW